MLLYEVVSVDFLEGAWPLSASSAARCGVSFSLAEPAGVQMQKGLGFGKFGGTVPSSSLDTNIKHTPTHHQS